MPDLFLCLDIAADTPERLSDLPNDHISWDVRKAMGSPVFNGEGWARTWRSFTDRDKALDYARSNPTLVVIPLNAATVPLEDIE